jgi:uncharacterized protein (TIGR03067 family)
MLRTVAVLLLVTAAILPAARADDPAAKFDPAKLVGDWEFVSGMSAGEKIPAERLPKKVIIAKDTLTLPGPDGQFVFGYKLDPATNPAKLDMTMKESPFGADPTVTKGLIQLAGDQLTLGYVQGTDKYPAKLESTKDNGLRLFVFKKLK